MVEAIPEATIEAKRQKKERKISWEETMLHGQFVQQTKWEIRIGGSSCEKGP